MRRAGFWFGWLIPAAIWASIVFSGVWRTNDFLSLFAVFPFIIAIIWMLFSACIGGLNFAAWLADGTDKRRWDEVAGDSSPLCAHANRVPVRSVPLPEFPDGELVAQWCPDCSTQLAPDWPTDDDARAAAVARSPQQGYGVCSSCRYVRVPGLLEPQRACTGGCDYREDAVVVRHSDGLTVRIAP